MPDYKSVIQSRLVELEGQIAALQDEQKRLATTLEVLNDLDMRVGSDTQEQPPENSTGAVPVATAVLRCLESSPWPLAPNEIYKLLSRRGDVSQVNLRVNMYSALHRLKKRGDLVKAEKSWVLAKRVDDVLDGNAADEGQSAPLL